MKIKNGFVMRDVLGKTLVVPTEEAGESMRGMIKLNETGKFIWTKVDEGKTEEEIAAALAETYEVTKETAATDVHAFIEKMKEAGVFEA